MGIRHQVQFTEIDLEGVNTKIQVFYSDFRTDNKTGSSHNFSDLKFTPELIRLLQKIPGYVSIDEISPKSSKFSTGSRRISQEISRISYEIWQGKNKYPIFIGEDWKSIQSLTLIDLCRKYKKIFYGLRSNSKIFMIEIIGQQQILKK